MALIIVLESLSLCVYICNPKEGSRSGEMLEKYRSIWWPKHHNLRLLICFSVVSVGSRCHVFNLKICGRRTVLLSQRVWSWYTKAPNLLILQEKYPPNFNFSSSWRDDRNKWNIFIIVTHCSLSLSLLQIFDVDLNSFIHSILSEASAAPQHIEQTILHPWINDEINGLSD